MPTTVPWFLTLIMLSVSEFITELRNQKSKIRRCFHVRDIKSFKIAQTRAILAGKCGGCMPASKRTTAASVRVLSLPSFSDPTADATEIECSKLPLNRTYIYKQTNLSWKGHQDASRTLEKLCSLRRGVRWRLTCPSKSLAIMFFFKKSVPVILEPPSTSFYRRYVRCRCTVPWLFHRGLLFCGKTSRELWKIISKSEICGSHDSSWE